jgi:hypothetical protein
LKKEIRVVRDLVNLKKRGCGGGEEEKGQYKLERAGITVEI